MKPLRSGVGSRGRFGRFFGFCPASAELSAELRGELRAVVRPDLGDHLSDVEIRKDLGHFIGSFGLKKFYGWVISLFGPSPKAAAALAAAFVFSCNFSWDAAAIFSIAAISASRSVGAVAL